MNPALLSRFDLVIDHKICGYFLDLINHFSFELKNYFLMSNSIQVFVLVDRPNEELDALLSDHIMNMHTNKSSTSTSQRLPFLSSHPPGGGTDGLKDRLRLQPGEEPDLVSKKDDFELQQIKVF